MKTLLVVGLVLAASFQTVEARGHSFGGPYHSSYRAPSYKPPKVYSCPGCNPSDHWVAPAVRSNGSYVRGHMQTDSNETRTDNFSHEGNVNPYTGQRGTKP